MNVTLCSAFRNASGYVPRYFAQIDNLANALVGRGDTLSLILAYGDSVDNTGEMVRCHTTDMDGDYGVCLFECSHGGPDHGSVVNTERFANMAKVWNAIWAKLPTDADAVIFVEADLIWELSTLLGLLDNLSDYPAIAPKILLRRHGWPEHYWYDNWAFWRNGTQIASMPPYFGDWIEDAPLQIDSAGSCLLMRGDVARQVAWPPEDVVVGVCRQIYEHGNSVWLDPKVSVYHP